MQLKLSCYKCGCTEFERTPICGLNDIGESKLNVVTGTKDRIIHSYLLPENFKENKAICKHCGLEDYIDNLPIKFD